MSKNSQADLQGMDQVYHIGQTKQVYIYHFITKNSVEECILECVAQKFCLDQLIIQQGHQQQSKVANKEELLEMIMTDAKKINNNNE